MRDHTKRRAFELDFQRSCVFLWELHLMAAVAFGEGRLLRKSRLEAAPTRARCFMAFSLQPNT
jgi:hypothetical protein